MSLINELQWTPPYKHDQDILRGLPLFKKKKKSKWSYVLYVQNVSVVYKLERSKTKQVCLNF